MKCRTSTGASPLWRSKTVLFVPSLRCNPLEGLSRPSKPPAAYSIPEVHTDFWNAVLSGVLKFGKSVHDEKRAGLRTLARDVRALVGRMAGELGLEEYDVLFSTVEYKKRAMRYFAEGADGEGGA